MRLRTGHLRNRLGGPTRPAPRRPAHGAVMPTAPGGVPATSMFMAQGRTSPRLTARTELPTGARRNSDG
ncbi:hypothetical protein [Nocardia cyriacigeorgica]|uniref:hypothetical protein n=1 Tax=Nocardia cyriacigeorgica TaxID=135487 RepID=UPI0013D768E0|nr:hypothetical protein [Nocardia cyriacigeorgica]NEW25566.1 hypothetical protein [Nocardia cyriacigeorgica]